MFALLWPPLAAFLLAVVFTRLVRPVALMTGAVAVPKEDRWHRGRIPLLGGVAIVGAVLTVAVLLPPLPTQAWMLLGGAAALAVVGLIDDLRPLPPQAKFLLQLVITSVLVAAGLRLTRTGYSAVDQILTLVWLVGVSNAFNLLDNMDGLAAGIGLIAAAFRCYFFLVDGNIEGAGLAGALAGALAGFLLYNFQPASVFMGDTGSLFIGLMVGGLNVIGDWPYSRGTVAVLLLPVMLLLVPLFDTAFVTVARTMAGRSVAQGGRDHTSHRLVALGMSERGAVLALYAMALASGAVAVLSYRYGLPYTATLAALLVAGLGVLTAKLALQRVYPERNTNSGMVRVLADFKFKKQVATVAIDAALVVIAYYSAYVLRFEGALDANLPMFASSLLIVLPCHALMLGLFRTYQDSWRHAGLRDLLSLLGAVTAGVALSVLVVLALYRFESYSRAVFVIHWLLLGTFLIASRVLFRALGELFPGESRNGPRTVIYGAGAGGVMVLREALSNRAIDWTVVGFIDDDLHKRRTSVRGVPVLGTLEEVAPLLTSGQVAQVVVSTGAVQRERLTALQRLCADAGVRTLHASIEFRDTASAADLE